MGPIEETAATESQSLAEIQRRFPDWDISYVFGAWQAVPKGTPVIRGMYLETLAEKLAEHEGREGVAKS